MNNKLIYSFNFIRYGSPSRKSEPNLDFEINDLALCKIAQAV